MSKMTRHQMREYVFILVFESLFLDECAEQILQQAQDCEFVSISDEVSGIFTEITGMADELDELIKPHLKKWTLSRISKVALSILRLAFYELLRHKDIDPPVVINEAVELAKTYSTPEDASFINGVLGSYVRMNFEK